MALEGLTLNGLSLNNGTTHMLTALQLPIPAKKPEWIEGSDANGAVLMRDPLVENGTLVATVDLIGSTKAQALSLIGAIVDELEEADRNPAGIPVVWTPAGGGLSMTFYALSGEVTQLENDIKFTAGNVPTVQITLKCRPGGYGALVTGPSQTTAGPVVQLTVPDVPGDMPTDEAYIVITDQSSQSRRHVEWGAEWLHHSAATPLILDSDSLVTSGYAGSQATWGTGSYNPDGAGTDSINATLYASAWTAVLSTGPQAHIGTFRVKARVMTSPGAAYFRFSWRVGDGDRTVNQEAYAMGPSANPNYREIDLGLVTIPPVTAGTQAWDGILEGKAADAYTTSLWNVDYLLLIPVEAGYGRARGQTEAGGGVVSATDGFSQSAGALNAKTMTLGGAWASSGSATDFQVTGSGTATRTAVSEVQWAGRFAMAGTTNYINVAPSLTMTVPLATNPAVGPVVRYVDASNWLAFLFSANAVYIESYETWLYVYICVAGSKTLLATRGAGISGTSAVLTVSGDVNASGVYTATLSTGTSTRTVSGSHTALATGGALATGKTGFYSETRGTSGVQTFDSFTAATVPLAVPAMYSGRTLEVTAAETRRQNSAGTMYGRPASYRGSRFVLNPEGSAGRMTRILAKAWRNDVDLGSEALPVTDSLKLQVFYRPCYSVVPR